MHLVRWHPTVGGRLTLAACCCDCRILIPRQRAVRPRSSPHDADCTLISMLSYNIYHTL